MQDSFQVNVWRLIFQKLNSTAQELCRQERCSHFGAWQFTALSVADERIDAAVSLVSFSKASCPWTYELCNGNDCELAKGERSDLLKTFLPALTSEMVSETFLVNLSQKSFFKRKFKKPLRAKRVDLAYEDVLESI